jgi:hypothetical protein
MMLACEFNESCHTSFAYVYIFASLGHPTKYLHLTLPAQIMTEKYILDLLWHTTITPLSKSIEMEDNLFLNLIWTICNIWYAL